MLNPELPNEARELSEYHHLNRKEQADEVGRSVLRVVSDPSDGVVAPINIDLEAMDLSHANTILLDTNRTHSDKTIELARFTLSFFTDTTSGTEQIDGVSIPSLYQEARTLNKLRSKKLPSGRTVADDLEELDIATDELSAVTPFDLAKKIASMRGNLSRPARINSLIMQLWLVDSSEWGEQMDKLLPSFFQEVRTLAQRANQ